MTSREAYERANPFAARQRPPAKPRPSRRVAAAVAPEPALRPKRFSASDRLVRAQLKAGAHVLTFGQAMIVATSLGLAGHLVKPGYRDPTAFKLREAR